MLDLAFNPQASLSGPDWWRDRLGLSLAAGLVGLVTWLGTWNRLQRAAEAAPALERGAQERRALVGTGVVLFLLVGAGFLVALLWLVLQALLGAPGDVSTASRGLKDLSTVVVLGGLAAWYGTILRADLRLGVAHRTVRAVILVAPGAGAALTALRRQGGLRTDVAGYLAGEPHTVGGDPAELAVLLAELGQSPAHLESALVVLRPDGAQVFPYARAQGQAAVAESPQPEPQAPPPAEAASSTGLPAPDGA
ncbi:MAG: hypothetical protein NVSMB65_20600 [Chloroflexota bacterium]